METSTSEGYDKEACFNLHYRQYKLFQHLYVNTIVKTRALHEKTPIDGLT